MGPGFPTTSLLTGCANFNAWSGIFFSYAEEKVCLEHIESEPIKPTVRDPDNEKEAKRERQWRKDRGAARTLLIESVSEQIKEEVNDVTKSPHELFTNLAALYGKADTSAITRYENAFCDIKHVPGDNVDVVIRKMQTAHRKLTDAGGKPIDQEKYIRQLIGWLAMDDDWTDSCKKYLKKIGKSSWSLERFRTELAAEQATFDDLKERKQLLAGGPTAAAATMGNNDQCAGAIFDNNRTNNRNRNNFNNNRNNNNSRNFNNNRNPNNNVNNNDRDKEKAEWLATQECYNCKIKGHFARDCGNPCGKCGKNGHGRKECRSGGRNNNNGGVDIAAIAAAVAKINAGSQPDAQTKTQSGLSGEVVALLAKNGYTVDEGCKSITRTRVPATQHAHVSTHTHTKTTTFTENDRAPAADKFLVTNLAEYDKASINDNNVDIKIDSCASEHFLTKDFETKLKDYRKAGPKTNANVTVGDGSKVPIIGEGNGSITITNENNETTTLPLIGAKFVPGMAWNLASVRRITMSGQNGYGVYFPPGGATCEIIEQPTGELGGKRVAIGTASESDPLYKVNGNIALGTTTRSMANNRHTRSTTACKSTTTTELESAVMKDLKLTHRQLGHVGEDRTKRALLDRYELEGNATTKIMAIIKKLKLDDCETCHYSGQKRTPVPGPPIASDKPIDGNVTINEWLHTDMGSMGDIIGRNGEKYFQVIVDESDKWGDLIMLKSKETEDLFPKFQQHINYIERQHGPGHKVKTIQSDGGEMTAGTFKAYFDTFGIKSVVTPKGTPRRNPVAERRIGILTTMAMAMLIHAKWPLEWWPDAMQAANERYNMLTSSSLDGLSPYEKRYNRKPDTSHLKVLFCPAYLLQRRDDIITEREKLGNHAIRVVYTGTAQIIGQGYQVYDPVTRRSFAHEYIEFDQEFTNASGQGRVMTLANGQVALDTNTGKPMTDDIVDAHGVAAPQLVFPIDHATATNMPSIAPQNVHLQWANGMRQTTNIDEQRQRDEQQDHHQCTDDVSDKTIDTSSTRPMTRSQPTPTSIATPNRTITETRMTSPVTPQRLAYNDNVGTSTQNVPDTTTTTTSPTPLPPAEPRRSARIAALVPPSYSQLNSTGTTSSANAAVNEWESGTEEHNNSGSVDSCNNDNNNSGSINNDNNNSGSIDNKNHNKNQRDYSNNTISGSIDNSINNNGRKQNNNNRSPNRHRSYQRHGGATIRVTRTLDERGMYPDEPREPKDENDLDTQSPGEQKKWRGAMGVEFDGLEKNKSWNLRPLRDGDPRPIPGKWVWKLKRDATTGEVTRYKARWVAMGCRLVQGRDYHTTFAACPRMQTFRLFCSIANSQRLHINLEDVAQAYLQGKLDDADMVLVEQPHGFEKPGKENWACDLEKGLYGIPQAGRVWQKTIHADLVGWGYKQNAAEPCLYTKHDDQGRLIGMTVIWVDDLPNTEWPSWIVASRDGTKEASLSTKLAAKYKTTTGPLQQFCGMQVKRNIEKRLLHLSQPSMIDQLVDDYGMTDAHAVSTPMEVGIALSKSMCPVTNDEINDMKDVPYRALIGSLGYLAQATRPDIATAVGKLARFVNNPGREHWRAAKRVVSYLKGTQNLGVMFRATGNEFTRDNNGHLCMKDAVRVYCDADYAADVDKRRSSTGYVVFVAGGPVSWKHALQQSTALSTAEAETMALSEAVQEAEWLRNVLTDMGIKIEAVTQIWEDNQAAIALAKDVRSGKRTKHMEVRWFFARGVIDKGNAEIRYCNTKDMIADMLTKALPRVQFETLRKKLGILPWTSDNVVYSAHASRAPITTTHATDKVTSGSVKILNLRHLSGLIIPIRRSISIRRT
jgi:hypothetical protein